jgi:hypothetical protein
MAKDRIIYFSWMLATITLLCVSAKGIASETLPLQKAKSGFDAARDSRISKAEAQMIWAELQHEATTYFEKEDEERMAALNASADPNREQPAAWAERMQEPVTEIALQLTQEDDLRTALEKLVRTVILCSPPPEEGLMSAMKPPSREKHLITHVALVAVLNENREQFDELTALRGRFTGMFGAGSIVNRFHYTEALWPDYVFSLLSVYQDRRARDLLLEFAIGESQSQLDEQASQAVWQSLREYDLEDVKPQLEAELAAAVESEQAQLEESPESPNGLLGRFSQAATIRDLLLSIEFAATLNSEQQTRYKELRRLIWTSHSSQPMLTQAPTSIFVTRSVVDLWQDGDERFLPFMLEGVHSRNRYIEWEVARSLIYSAPISPEGLEWLASEAKSEAWSEETRTAINLMLSARK